MDKAHAIVYVTHDLESAAKFCTRAIEIERGTYRSGMALRSV